MGKKKKILRKVIDKVKDQKEYIEELNCLIAELELKIDEQKEEINYLTIKNTEYLNNLVTFENFNLNNKEDVYVCISEDCDNVPLKYSEYCIECLNNGEIDEIITCCSECYFIKNKYDEYQNIIEKKNQKIKYLKKIIREYEEYYDDDYIEEDNKIVLYNKNNIYSLILFLTRKINNFIYNIYKAINKPFFNYILTFCINKEKLLLTSPNFSEYKKENIKHEDNNSYNIYNEYYKWFKYMNHLENVYNDLWLNYGIHLCLNNNEVIKRPKKVSIGDALYNYCYYKKVKKDNRKRKKNTVGDDDIINNTINNVINGKEKHYKDEIMKKMYKDNRELINKYIYYYDLYIDKRNNISKNDYENILENVLNIRGNMYRHNKIVSIYKEMNKYKLFDIKILFRYYTFEHIKKDQIVHFVYLLNKKLLDELEKGELEIFNPEFNEEDLEKYYSDEYDTEIEDDYQEIIKNPKNDNTCSDKSFKCKYY